MNLLKMLLVLAVCLTFSAYASDELTQADASAIISNVLNKDCKPVSIGNALISPDQDPRLPRGADPDDYPGWWMFSDPEDEFGLHRILEKAGIFEIEERPSSLGENWREVTVRLSPKGKDLVEQWGLPRRENVFCIKRGNLKITNIGRNELHQKGLDNYRVLMGTGDWEFTEEMEFVTNEVRLALMKAGMTVPETDLRSSKFIVLLKHDPFRGEWRFVTADMAQVDEEFQSNRVLEYLQKR